MAHRIKLSLFYAVDLVLDTVETLVIKREQDEVSSLYQIYKCQIIAVTVIATLLQIHVGGPNNTANNLSCYQS